VDRNDIERLRDPGFTIARRGYDQREVDKLLGSVVDWLETDAPKELGDMAARRKLELVGRSTTRILVTADEESAQLRRLDEDECAALRSDAEAASLKMRQAADEYAKKQREAADEDARRTAAAASAKAAKIVEEGERRRAEIEAVVAELESQRDRTVHEMERLRSELGSTIGTHTEAKPRSTKKQPAADDAGKARASAQRVS
jgi:hypothetical protein